MDKEQLLRKTKRLFCLEYLIIGIILLTVGLLRLFDVIPYNANRLLVYNIITLIGAAYFAFDLSWFIFSKKKRERSDLIDKLLPIPLSIYLLIFDILVLAKIYASLDYVKYSISAVLIYGGSFAIFLGIYHYFKPSKMMLSVVEDEYNEAIEEKAKQISEEVNKEDEGSAK